METPSIKPDAPSTFVLTAGLHSVRQLRPRSGDVLLGAPGSALNGSINITGRRDVLLHSLNVSSEHDRCARVKLSQHIRVAACDIGPCGTLTDWRGSHLGLAITQSQNVSVTDSYVHSEHRPTNATHKPWATAGPDLDDSIYVSDCHSVFLRGNVVAFGETNIQNA